MTQRIYEKRKPTKCPQCGEKPVARIQYGYPNFDGTLKQDMLEGITVLGGCMLLPTRATWKCTFCNLPIYKEQDKDEIEDAFNELTLLEVNE